MVTIAQIEQGAVRFIDAEIAPEIPPNIPNGQLKKIAAVEGAVYAVWHGLQKAVSSPALAAIGAVDAEGNIDMGSIVEIAAG